MPLEKLVLQGHVVLRLETNTGTEDVDQGTSLLSKSIDDWCSWRGQWSLKHVAEDAENGMESGEILGSNSIGGVSLPFDASHHLSEDHKIDDQWRSKE